MIPTHNAPFHGEDDLQAMIELVLSRPTGRVNHFPGMVDLQEMLALPEVQAGTRLWREESGRLIGFAFLDQENLCIETAEPFTGGPLEGLMIAWACRKRLQEAGPEAVVETSCRSSNPGRMAILEAMGFERMAEGAVYMARSLHTPIPAPKLPAGYHIRPLNGDAEVVELVALHQKAWGTQNMTVEYRLAMMNTSSYDPAMDLVMEAPDGSLSAYCTCFFSLEENRATGSLDGYTDPLATHPDMQGRGLARALLSEGMRRLQAHGLEWARLSTSSDNIAMQRAAEAVGFRIVDESYRYEKHLGGTESGGDDVYTDE